MRRHATRPMRATLGVAAAAMLAPAAAASSNAYVEAFDVYFGGVRAGELALDVRFNGEGEYEARSHLNTAGVVGFFYDAFYDAEAKGVQAGADRMKPRQFAAKTNFDGDRQDLIIHFGPTGPRNVEADPPFKPKAHEIDPRAQIGAIDPLSAAVALVAPTPEDDLCNRDVTIFDGRHRIDITLKKPKQLEGQIRCDAVFKRVAGFRPKDMAKQTDFPFRIYFEPWRDGLARLKQIVVETSYGAGVVRRKE